MRCAMELLEISKAVRMEKELQKQREERLRKEKLEKSTIENCVAFGKTLEQMACSGKDLKLILVYNDKDKCLMSSSSCEYADKRVSHYRQTSKDSFDIKIATKWFSHFCFEIKVIRKSQGYWYYGAGFISEPLYTIEIVPMPQC